LDGQRTARLRNLVETFRQCGFPTTTSRDMDGWLKAHAFFVTAISGAIYMAGGDCHRLSEDKATVVLMAKGVREGYSAVRALGLSVEPFALRVLFTWLPPAFAIYYWRRFFASEMADYVFGRHARTASREMRELANDCRSLLEKSCIEAPALRQLYRSIDAYVAYSFADNGPASA
jgi:2-dehydropantoate 2-reductase